MFEKKGQLEFIVIFNFVIVMGLLIAGTYYVTNEPSSYVGDITTFEFYDIDCIEQINQEDRVRFESYKVATSLNFTYLKRCPN